MSDKEKLIFLINNYIPDGNSFEDIVIAFMSMHKSEFSLRRVHELMTRIDRNALAPSIDRHDRLRFVANERAGYMHKYLSGKMFPNEEIAKKYVDCQIDNAQAIIDLCKEG